MAVVISVRGVSQNAALGGVAKGDFKGESGTSMAEGLAWWTPITADTTDIYFGRPAYGQGKVFAAESTLMTYDAVHRKAYCLFSGVD